MSTFKTRSKSDGRLEICLWAGPTSPDLSDPNNWVDIAEAEEQVRELLASQKAEKQPENAFSFVEATRVWARWNAKASNRVSGGIRK